MICTNTINLMYFVRTVSFRNIGLLSKFDVLYDTIKYVYDDLYIIIYIAFDDIYVIINA